MSARVALLANPTAGGGRGRTALGPVLERLGTVDPGVRVLVGRDAADAERLSREAVADGVDVLAALGGDGLVSTAVQAVAGTDVALAVLPAGTGNDAARTLGLPLDPLAAVEVVRSGHRRTVDLGRVGGRVFLNVLSSGFDSQVNERANRMTWPRGAARYPAAMLGELRVFRPVAYEVRLDGELLRLPAMLVAVGNGRSYGGGMQVCPGADLADGLLDVTVLAPVPTLRFLRLFPQVYDGRHVHLPEVSTFRVRTVSLAAPGMTAYADGEPLGPLPLTAEAVPAGVTVLVPDGRT